MKQIPLLQGKAMLIEIPEGATNTAITPRTSEQQELLYNMPNTLYALTGAILPPGNWRIIGMLSEVTENQLDGVIESDTFMGGGVTIHKNYNQGGWLPTRVMSLESAILAEGYYLDENPIEYPSQSDPKFYDEPYDGTGFYQELYSGAIEEYRQAQSRVLDRSRCLLLGRES